MIKKLCCIMLSILFSVSLFSCSGSSDREKLCANIWESSVDFIEFTEDGKILHNFESPEESVSYYKLQRGGKINMYTEEGEEYGIVLDYRFEGDKLYIGAVEYTPLEEASETEADGKSNPEDYPDVSFENPQEAE